MVRPSWWFVVGLVTGAAELSAQARISGVVRDSAGSAIAGAEVSVQNTARTATTDRNGAFVISGIATGTWVVSVRRLGFAPASTSIRLMEGDNQMADVVMIAKRPAAGYGHGSREPALARVSAATRVRGQSTRGPRPVRDA